MKDNQKISIITVCLNSVETIKDTLESIDSQCYSNIEHIVIDGGSKDGTLDIVNHYRKRIAVFISEPDKGIYDAMNKGIRLARGHIIGMLNAGDTYETPDCLAIIARSFKNHPVDCLFADLVYVPKDKPKKIIRYYKSKCFHPKWLSYGIMPAHPTVFFKRECYRRYGVFKTNYQIAADFELIARFLSTHNIKYRYIPKVMVRMRLGGRSTKSVASNITINREMLRACNENGINTNYIKIYSKYFFKIFEFINHPQI